MSNAANQAEEMTARAPSGDYSQIAWETLSSLDRLCQTRTSNGIIPEASKVISPVDEHAHGVGFQKAAVQQKRRTKMSDETAARMGSGVVDRFLHAAQVLEGEHVVKGKAVQATDTQKELSKLERIRAKNRKAQQRFREKSKRNMQKMHSDLHTGQAKVIVLHQQLQQLRKRQHVLFEAFSMRKNLQAIHASQDEACGKIALTCNGMDVDSGAQHTEMDAAEMLKQMKAMKKTLRETLQNDSPIEEVIFSYKQLSKSFWNMCMTAPMTCMDMLSQATQSDEPQRAYESLVEDIISVTDDVQNRACISLYRAEKSIERVLCWAKMANGWSDGQCIQKLSGLDYTSAGTLAIAISLYRDLEEILSEEECASIWAHAPSVIPDAMAVLRALQWHG